MQQQSSDNSSTDSQFTENEEEPTLLEACMECDEDALYDIIQDGVTYEQVNERDKSGRTGLSHACGNGFIPILELLADVEEVDVNLADNEGNTPLIFAAQAGHGEVVSFLLNNFKRVRVDQSNNLGCTALMKAAIQGRTRCAKLLLFAGASPKLRDHGRNFCAEDWARFCGRIVCSEAIAKLVRSRKYYFKKKFMLSKDKWNSEPDLQTDGKPGPHDKVHRGWIQRHLKRRVEINAGMSISMLDVRTNPLYAVTRCASTPLLPTFSSPPHSPRYDRLPCDEELLSREVPCLKITPDQEYCDFASGISTAVDKNIVPLECIDDDSDSDDEDLT